MAEISKITLPSGNTYDIKDTTARQLISGGISFNVVWNATDYASSTTPTAGKLASIPKGVVVQYNSGASGATGTGTLAPSSDTIAKFYLIYSKVNESDNDILSEILPYIKNKYSDQAYDAIFKIFGKDGIIYKGYSEWDGQLITNYIVYSNNQILNKNKLERLH